MAAPQAPQSLAARRLAERCSYPLDGAPPTAHQSDAQLPGGAALHNSSVVRLAFSGAPVGGPWVGGTAGLGMRNGVHGVAHTGYCHVTQTPWKPLANSC